jgi:hypothetical protein
MPITMYVFWLLFMHPFGWLIINTIIPLKAMSEYAQVHEKMLKYVLKRDENELKEGEI